MEIKEFKVDSSGRGKKQIRYPDEPKEGAVNYKIYSVIVIIAVFIAIIIAVFIKLNKFDIKQYIKPVYTGANGYASVTFVIDEDALSEKLLGKNPDSDRQYYVGKFIESLSVHTDAVDIKNADTLKVIIDYNEAYAVGAKADIPHREYTYKVKGISDGAVVDLYSGVSVSFTGISPDAKIIVSNDWEDEYLKTITFSADKTEQIKLGDTVKVVCDTSYEELARHGIIARFMEMNYTADMLSSYCEAKDSISSDIMNTIYDEIISTISKETENVTYRMLFAATGNTDYLYHINEEKADDIKIEAVYFINNNINDSENNDIKNYIAVEASANISDNEESEQVYFMFIYSNAYVTVNGEFNIVHDNPDKRFACSISQEKLYDEYVGDLKNSYTIDRIR